jgi:hypothetical protein
MWTDPGVWSEREAWLLPHHVRPEKVEEINPEVFHPAGHGSLVPWDFRFWKAPLEQPRLPGLFGLVARAGSRLLRATVLSTANFQFHIPKPTPVLSLKTLQVLDPQGPKTS